MALKMNLNDSPEIKSVYDDIYCSMFEKVIEEQMIINYSQKVVAKDSKLSVRSVTPYTKTQINFLNGNQFYGDMSECRMTGNGRFLWAHDGSLYEGEFSRANVIEGRGTLKFRDAAAASSSSSSSSTGFSRYCGSFVNGMYHGRGQLINYFFKYNGNFECDKFHGKGNLKCGIESFDGCFASGKRLSGKRIYINGTFTGDFDEHETRRHGRYNFDNGDCYCGAFKNGLFDGYGEYMWASSSSSSSHYESSSYCGYWKENHRQGLGMLNLLNGTRCTTIFEGGVKDGSGVVWAANNTIHLSKAMFASDEFIDCKQIVINQENIGIIRRLFDASELQKMSCAEFVASVAMLEANYSVTTAKSRGDEGEECMELLTYPFHLNWFDLHVEHDAIWEFVRKIPNTNKQQEFTSIVQFVREHASTFGELYRQYAEYSTRALLKNRNGGGELTRVGLWQLFRDLRVYKKSALYNTQRMIEAAETDFNILTFDSHNPFEVVSLANFLHYLLYVVLQINKHHAFMLSAAINQRSRIFGVFATMCALFVRDFLLPVQPACSGMIPRLIQEDKTFLIKFIDSVITKSRCQQQLSIRDIFRMVDEKCESGFIGKLEAYANGNVSKK
jgi:hypothetical protein